MIKWCTGAYELNWCKEMAKELRATGEYERVRVQKLRTSPYDPPDTSYGHIYVEVRKSDES